MFADLVQTFIYISFSALFSASEVSLFSIPREDMPGLAKGTGGEKRISKLLERGEETLIAILLGNIFVNLMVVGLVGKLVKAAVGDSPLLFFLGSTGVLLVLGEILPKAVAIKLGKRVVLITAPFLLFVRTVFKPLILVFKKINRTLLRLNYFFLLSSPYPFITGEEYTSALDRAAENGDVSENVSRFLREMCEIVNFPLSRVVIHRTFLQEENSKFEVILTENGTVKSLRDRNAGLDIVDIQWISISRTIGDVMKLFRETGLRVVLVHDEYGEFYGVATSETIYDYLCNLYNETEISARSIDVGGSEPVARYLNWFDDEMLDRFPEIRSIGGLLMAWFESIPVKGAIFESKSCIFEVLQAEQNSVGKLRITRK